MKDWKWKLLLIAACGLRGGLFLGCAPLAPGAPTTTQEQYVVDDVKRLSPSITAGNDPTSWLQNTYPISPSSHLLLRYEEFLKDVSNINIDNGNSVQVWITGVSPSDYATAITSAQLCAVTRNWMPFCTWLFADPFPGDGWSTPGGDFDAVSADCPFPTASPSPGPTSPNTFSFDVTNWYKNYPRGRNVNMGLILISSQPISIFGENSGAYAPQFVWQQNQ